MKWMKTMLIWSLIIVLFSCTNDLPKPQDEESTGATNNEELSIPSGFTFKTIKDYTLTFEFLNSFDEPVQGVVFEIFDEEPTATSTHLFIGQSNAQGKCEVTLRVPTSKGSIFLSPKSSSFGNVREITLTDTSMHIVVGGERTEKIVKVTNASLKRALAEGYRYIWDHNELGVPVGMSRDNFDGSFLNMVDATLPESQRLYYVHPDYFELGVKSNVNVLQDVELSATFVHEGAMFTNAVGYYYFDTNNPPQSPDDIEDLFLFFPNISYFGEGGGLGAGDKVQLRYFNPATSQYQSTFPAGITVGWFLVADGWENATDGVVDTNKDVWYSFDQFNTESNVDRRKHIVTLKDIVRDILLIGFEDVHREKFSDEDFNDAIIYLTPVPFEAVDYNSFPPVATQYDSDNDGVIDELDEFPQDSNLAFQIDYPAGDTPNSLVFEDNWPKRGDYDFNDMVIDYSLSFFVTPQDELHSSTMEFTLRATGAGFHNGFGVEFPFSPDDVESVTGYGVLNDYINLRPNGLEAGQDKSVYIVFDNSYRYLLSHKDFFVNTQTLEPYVEPVKFVIETTFKPGVPRTVLAQNYFNPFLIQSRDRGVEVHLNGFPGTDLANESLWGTKDDRSDGVSTFYVGDNQMPWALELPLEFEYAEEYRSITSCYNYFIEWCNSGGSLFPDWMDDISGYRQNELLYRGGPE